jgi:hypothetical protein
MMISNPIDRISQEDLERLMAALPPLVPLPQQTEKKKEPKTKSRKGTSAYEQNLFNQRWEKRSRLSLDLGFAIGALEGIAHSSTCKLTRAKAEEALVTLRRKD